MSKFKNNGRRIHLPEEARKKLEQEQMEGIQLFMEEAAQWRRREDEALDLVVKEEVRSCLKDGIGVPSLKAEDVALLVQACTPLAKAIAHAKMKMAFERIADIIKLKGIEQLPEAVIWSASLAGVELVPAEPQERPLIEAPSDPIILGMAPVKP